jgi:hypothetical protein
MTKDEALRLALEALESASYAIESWGSYASEYFQDKHDLQTDINNTQQAITAIKAALEANEFNPDWDTQAVLTEEIQRMAKRIEELEAKDEPVAYPEGDVVGPCICGSWPGGKCLKCPRTTPPQRTWVGLTNEDRFEFAKAQHSWEDLIIAAEAKLRSKNT